MEPTAGTAEVIITGADMSDKIDFLAAAFAGMDANAKIRTFMSMGRDCLSADWLSVRGIKEKFTESYIDFFDSQFFKEDHDRAINKLFPVEKIDNFCASIVDELTALKEGERDLFDKIFDTAKLEFFDDATALKNPLLGFLNGYVPSESQAAPEPRKEKTETKQRAAATAATTTAPAPAAETTTASKSAEPETASEFNSRIEAHLHAVAENAAVVEEKRQASPLPSFSMNGDSMAASIELPIGPLVRAAVESHLNGMDILRHIDRRIKEEASKLKPTIIQIGERKSATIMGRTHSSFKELLHIVNIEGQAFISGPAGTGKTTLGKQVAQALDLYFGFISCSAGMAESQLLGRMNAQGEYLESDLVKCYERGGLFLFDEIDAADANTMLVINSALANGYLSLPNRKEKPHAERHSAFRCICAANTWGFGSAEYAGRNILDAAFLDRFVGGKLIVDYDFDLEREISKEFPEVAKFIWQVRKNCIASRVRRVVSTRAVGSGVRAALSGDSLKIFAKRFFTGWTKEEREKALVGTQFEKQDAKTV